MRNAVATLLGTRRAATALEFALVAPVFLFTVGMIFQVGIMLYSQTTLDMATRLAARTVQTGTAQQAADSQGVFGAALCGNATSILLRCSELVYAVASGSSFSGIVALQSAPSSASFSPGSQGSMVVVQVFLRQPLILPLFGSLLFPSGQMQLSSTLAFRNGYYGL